MTTREKAASGGDAVQARAHIDLAEMPANERLGCWVDEVCAASAEADCELSEPERLYGRLEHLHISDIAINHLRVSAQTFRRTRAHLSRARDDVFALVRVQSGQARVEQGERRIVLDAGDLGQRMQAAIAATPGPVLLVGTDCPALTVQHLRTAAAALQGGTGTGTGTGAKAVFIPAEDGGYVLVGLQQPQPGLFQGIDWSTERVMAQTRQRAGALGVALHELAPLWDVDTPDDLARLATLPEFAPLLVPQTPARCHPSLLSPEPACPC